jgi:hypothetical protein
VFGVLHIVLHAVTDMAALWQPGRVLVRAGVCVGVVVLPAVPAAVEVSELSGGGIPQ